MISITSYKRSIRRRARLGVSLLEVLIAIFVLMVGLLGVAALIPAGRHHMAEAIKADRASACGQAILHEAKVRGWLDPTMWRYLATNPNDRPVVISGTSLIPARTYVIDPLFIASNMSDPNARYFPHSDTDADMVRVTLARVSGSTDFMPLPVAERLCRWHDDLLFPTPDDPNDRPREMVLADLDPDPDVDDLQRIRWPVRPAEDGVTSSAAALTDENEGHFTWLLTVTPGPITYRDLNPVDGIMEPYFDISQPLSYHVSVVVFHKRVFVPPVAGETPDERAITSINFSGGGWGGGEATLTAAAPEYLNVKENDWIMVQFPASGNALRYEWYRVVAAEADGSTTRRVTLAGADNRFDWNANETINDAGDTGRAVVISNVISVFTATIPSEGRD